MAIRADHEIHHRRFGRNLGVALALVAFVALTFALTVVKVERGDSMPNTMGGANPALANDAPGQAAAQQTAAPTGESQP